MVDTELLSYLVTLAAALSGYPAVPLDQLPLVQRLSPHDLKAEVCPQQSKGCDDIVALFDSDHYRILISDQLDLQDSSDNSFLLHELVHVLQFRYIGGTTFASCQDTLRSEREAYKAQNAYLRRQGRLERYGDMLMHVSCAPVQPRGGTSVTLEMSPGGPNEAAAFDSFMDQLQRDRGAARRSFGDWR